MKINLIKVANFIPYHAREEQWWLAMYHTRERRGILIQFSQKTERTISCKVNRCTYWNNGEMMRSKRKIFGDCGLD
jgi:hypothetical protein